MKIEISNQSKWKESVTLKLALLAFLGLMLLIPLQMIKEVIMERQTNAENVKTEISSQWAMAQTVSGPVLNVPVRTIPVAKDEKPRTSVWHILPANLAIKGEIRPEVRYRGIYRSVVYNSDVLITGAIEIPDREPGAGLEILWNEAYITLGISDNRGLKGEIKLVSGETSISPEPGVRDREVFGSGITFPLSNTGEKKQIPFSLSFSLAGSEALMLTPLGKTTTASLASAWADPSFSGSFLPTRRDVKETGFTADWEITHLNRNFPQDWVGDSFSPEKDAFGVTLITTVDHYQKSWRSARYGILFIALTFLVLIFLEVTRKERIHILHYFLVALGLVLFFSLLNALSEHIGFAFSYLVSSVATIGLISFFTSSLFKNSGTGFIVAGMLALLYSFTYILLTLNDYAYLAGNVGLFILLAVIMKLSGRLRLNENTD
jgi:inner membrane protein